MPSTPSATDPRSYYEVLSTFWAASCTARGTDLRGQSLVNLGADHYFFKRGENVWALISFRGPAWVTGGVLGTEASFFMYIALMFLHVAWRQFDSRTDT